MTNTQHPKRLRVRGHDVNVHRYGAGNAQAIVLVHGIGVSSRYFRRLAAELARSYAVYSLDLPGYGDTPKPKRPLSIPELADIVNETVTKLQLHRPVLIGHSMGCQIVAQAERRQPDYEKLILMSPTVNKDERHVLIQAWRLLQDSFKEPLQTNLTIFQDYFRMGPIRYLRTSKTMLVDKLEESLHDIHIPVLILRGTRDQIAPHDWCAYLKRVAEQGALAEIPDGAHAVHHTHPQKVEAACRAFIDA